jgi:hypothetical protein
MLKRRGRRLLPPEKSGRSKKTRKRLRAPGSKRLI